MSARPETLQGLFEHAAALHPDARAVEDSEGRHLTYRQLDEAASRMACRLRQSGVVPGDRVGVSMPKSINSLICVLGALKANAVYVPADFSAPPERNRLIFGGCGARVICLDEPRAETLRAGGAALAPFLVFPGEGTAAVGAPWLDGLPADWRSEHTSGPDDVSYILYTSGSTGVPKGVVHTHRSALSFVYWAADVMKPVGTDRFSSHAPFHFDLSILDLYVPMASGAAIVLVGEELGKDPVKLAQFISERRITCWYSVPSIQALLAQYGHLERLDWSGLRVVNFAGEVFPIKHLRALKRLWPAPIFYNLYGPTETNVCTYFRVPDVVEEGREVPYPIGVPCENVEALVLDADNRPVEGNAEGLLHIHASGPVTQGYWDLPEQTERAFLTDAEGRRWYNTGDVVTREADGNLIYVGRRDRMVKRRGYRVELGEIEAALYKHPEVREAAVVAKQAPDGVTIWAYMSTHGTTPSIIALKEFCAINLPGYMSPDRFKFLPALPRTSTDKVDYQSLLLST